MLEQLKKDVYDANMLLPEKKLVVYTWGNVSGVDREKGLVVIKPSGVDYDAMTPDDMVVVDLDGTVVEGDCRPSSDLMTHLEIYRSFPGTGGVVHTHSRWATVWAQAGRDIPAYGTTHADYMYGAAPCTRMLSAQEVESAYEACTGKVIVETFQERQIDPCDVPAVLVRGHGPFTWGKDAKEAVRNAVVLEEVAMMAWHTEALFRAQAMPQIPDYIKDKHFMRKHGPNAYYGQAEKKTE